VDIPGPNKVTSTGIKCKQSRINEISNITELTNNSGSELEAVVDLSSKNEIWFELLKHLYSDSDTGIKLD
jgi:hypothetical protein